MQQHDAVDPIAHDHRMVEQLCGDHDSLDRLCEGDERAGTLLDELRQKELLGYDRIRDRLQGRPAT
ncbi:hypothetical protein ACH347_27150 [Saccharopolyspora sp. 5N102]|uniref:hypothetical protein n=1 Tax=Saccharopolyspora sp. 5N102 TaxID=3375155 RepID=UPI0037B14B5A